MVTRRTSARPRKTVGVFSPWEVACLRSLPESFDLRGWRGRTWAEGSGRDVALGALYARLHNHEGPVGPTEARVCATLALRAAEENTPWVRRPFQYAQTKAFTMTEQLEQSGGV